MEPAPQLIQGPRSSTPRYRSRQDLAAQTGLSPATLQRYKAQNRIPYYQPAGKGGRVLFPPNAIEVAVAAAQADRNDPQGDLGATTTAAPAQQQDVRQKLPGPRPRWLTRANQEER